MAEDYRAEWPGDTGIDLTRCRAMAYDRVSCHARQCRMRPLVDGLCRHHAKTKDLPASCPVCMGPSGFGLCDTCQSALDEVRGQGLVDTEVALFKWLCDRARASLRWRLGKEEKARDER